MKKFKVTFEPGGGAVEVLKGTTIKEAAMACGIMLNMPCGGRGRCGKCLVQIKRGRHSPGPVDEKFIARSKVRSGYRLACLTEVRSDTAIKIPSSSLLHPKEVLVEATRKRYALDPEIRKHYIPDQKVTAVFDGDELLGREVGDTTRRLFGMSLDIGTTTVAGSLVDLNKGRRLSVGSRMNEQVLYGDDAVSRISFAQINEDGLKLLNRKVIGTINKVIEETARCARIDREDIYQVTAVGNPVMHHLALSIPPTTLTDPPYGPAITEPFSLQAEGMGIRINPKGVFKFLPLIAGFLGADSVGLILSSRLNKSKDIRLAVDIGTNGEVIMGSGRKLIATSCAAGPAFEGAHIGCGMRAAKGAIESVRIQDGKVILGVIGGGRPIGICGSGLIDTVSALLASGVIDQQGRMRPDRFNLYRDKTRSIDITQADVREVQLAKGAIRAGIEILKKDLGIEDDEISEALLAGAFGSYIRPESAIRIGLIPDIPLDKIRFIGNAPLMGAELALCSRRAADEAFQISQKVEYINLSDPRKDFQKEFAKYMRF